jgi:hypothetical protein
MQNEKWQIEEIKPYENDSRLNDATVGAAANSMEDEAETSHLLVSARQAAAMCGRSLRTWRSWDSQGLIPRATRIKRSTFWRPDELRAWVAAGCPRRAEWESRSNDGPNASDKEAQDPKTPPNVPVSDVEMAQKE